MKYLLDICVISKVIKPSEKNKLKLWIEKELKERFKGRFFELDMHVVTKWGELQGKSEINGKPLPTIDGLIAVTGLVSNCTVVTRNVSYMEQTVNF